MLMELRSAGANVRADGKLALLWALADFIQMWVLVLNSGQLTWQLASGCAVHNLRVCS